MKANLSRSLSLFFVLFPILDIYGIGISGFSIGKIILILIFASIILNDFIIARSSLKNVFLFFVLFISFIPFLLNIYEPWFSSDAFFYKLIGFWGFFLTLILCGKYLEWPFVFKYYKIVVHICIALFLIQELAFFLFNYRISAIIPGVPLTNMDSSDSYIEMQTVLDRSCSFFMEPTYFVYYLAIYYIHIAFKSPVSYKSREFLLLTLTLLLSRSGNGFMILMSVLCAITYQNLYGLNHKLKLQNIILIIGMVIVGCCILNFLGGFSVFEKSFERIDELQSDGSTMTSGFHRIYSGYTFIQSFEFKNLLFGLSLGNANSYYLYYPLSTYRSLLISGGNDVIYLNGIQTILAFGGVSSLIIYLICLKKLFTKNFIEAKVLILVLLISHFIGSNFNSVFMLFSLVFTLYYKNVFDRCRLYKS